MTDLPTRTPFRILSLDGGGAKGFYTLGVLREVEGMLGCRLHESFDLIFGTSTGSIIGALIALGHSIEEIDDLYRQYVPVIMGAKTPAAKSEALRVCASAAFGEKKFDSVKTGVGIVATKWMVETPMIFKAHVSQAHGRTGTFSPGFGCTISDAVQASCSAYPFFERRTVETDRGDRIELVDGGYCANNPTLYAIADATAALNIRRDALRVLSVGVGIYPEPKSGWIKAMLKRIWVVQLLQKTLEINTQSMEQLRAILFKDIQTVRVNQTFERPEMATDMFEHNLDKLNQIRQWGSESFALREGDIRNLLS